MLKYTTHNKYLLMQESTPTTCFLALVYHHEIKAEINSIEMGLLWIGG